MQKLPKPYCVSFCVDRETGDFRIEGETWKKFAEIMEEFEKKPLAVMINCSPAELISKNLTEMRKVIPKDIKIGCYPNNFSWVQQSKAYDPSESAGNRRTDMNAQIYEKLCNEWIELGAETIGGCCEVGPEYMESITKAFAGKK